MKNTINITTTELNTILSNVTMVKGMGNIIALTQYTTPKITKKCRDTKEPNTFNAITKLTNLSVILNTTYENVVGNRLIKEGKEVEDYTKGKNTMVIEKCENNNFFGHFNGKAVLEYKPNEGSKPRTKFLVDGKVTDKAKLPNVLPSVYKATNQGLDNDIPWRKLYTVGIRRISINGQRYKVVN